MDPVSIAGAAAHTATAAWKVGFKLYDFIQSTRNVDATVRQLHSEVEQVGNICTLVEAQIKHLKLDDSDHESLCKAIKSQIEGCETAINKIDAVLVPVDKQGTNFVKQAVSDPQMHKISASLLRLMIGSSDQIELQPNRH